MSTKSQKIDEKMRACEKAALELEARAGISPGSVFGAFEFRKAYFSVQDMELRKQLIAHHRKHSALWQESIRQWVSDAEASLAKARVSADYWCVWASLIGVGAVSIGSYFGTPGAIGGALVGYFFGRQIEQDLKSSRDRDVVRSEADLNSAKESARDARKEPETFSQQEEETGEPTHRI